MAERNQKDVGTGSETAKLATSPIPFEVIAYAAATLPTPAIADAIEDEPYFDPKLAAPAPGKYPDPVIAIVREVRNNFPNASVTVDTPRKPEGIWFIDICLDDHWTVVQWKAGMPFGLSTNPDPNGFGEGADEVYEDASSAYSRIAFLLANRAETVPPPPRTTGTTAHP